MMSAMRWAVRRICAEFIVNANPASWRLLGHIEQPKTHLEAAVARRLHAADHQRVGGARLPVGEIDLAGLGGHRVDPARKERAKAAAAGEIGLDDVGERLRQRRFAGERQHGNGNLVGAAARDLDGELGVRGAGHENK